MLNLIAVALTLLLDWHPNVNHEPLYKKRCFEAEHIELNIVESAPADLSIRLGPQLLRAMDRGEELDLIAVLVNRPLQGFCTPANKPIQSVSDIKVVGVKPRGTTASILHVFSKDIICIPSRDFDEIDVLGGCFENVEPFQFNEPMRFISIMELGVPHYPELLVVSKKGLLDEGTKQAFCRALKRSIGEEYSLEGLKPLRDWMKAQGVIHEPIP